MIKIIKNLLFAYVICISFSAFSSSQVDNEEDNYQDEGRLLFKIRVHGLLSHATQKGLTTKNQVSNAKKVGHFIENGYGGDVATTIFFSDNIASELSLGFDVLKTKYASIRDVGSNYGVNNKNLGKKKDVFMIPVTLTGQYHIAPFGGIRPYVGLGYHGAYMFSKCKLFDIKNGHGAVMQVGVDFVAKDDTMINFDIRQYFLNTKVAYKESFISPAVTSKVKINPLIISLGIGFKF